MRILKTIFVFILFFFCCSIYAQKLNPSSIRINKEHIKDCHQIGLSIEANKNISFAYRIEKPNKISLRANVNAKASTIFRDAILVDFSTTLVLSAGLEKHIIIRNNFSAYYGGEAKLNTLIYGFALRRNELVLSGLTGIKFKPHTKIAFFAEALFGFRINSFAQNQNILWAARNANNFNLGVLYTIVT